MRAWISMTVALCCASTVLAREDSKPRSASPVRVAQLAPDGFPLRFPQEPQAPLPARPAVAAPEELPPPARSAPLTFPAPPALIPPPASVPALPARYLTHREFAATFRPAPGNYEVMLLHPYTHRPVKVRFTLPPGRIREVDADPSELRFDYGKWELEVHFKRDGRVVLDIDD